jgi:hypothetical protein
MSIASTDSGLQKMGHQQNDNGYIPFLAMRCLDVNFTKLVTMFDSIHRNPGFCKEEATHRTMLPLV